MIVRDAAPQELEAVRALTVRAFEQYGAIMSAGTWAGLRGAVDSALDSTEPAHRLVVERDGKLVGSVLLFAPSTDAYGGIAKRVAWPEVRMLAVDPSARGLGVGQLLMDECVRRARRDDASAIGLHTSDDMRAARMLYTRMGFVRVPEFDFLPPGGEMVEAYRLELVLPAMD
ncbi:MAG: GNAT family N-acetyltransferase [bacterium]